MRKFLFLLPVVALFCFGAVQPKKCGVLFDWKEPGTIASDNDCADMSVVLAPEYLRYVHYVVKWKRTTDTEWTTVTTEEPRLAIPDIPCGTQVEIRVGSAWLNSEHPVCLASGTVTSRPYTTACQAKK